MAESVRLPWSPVTGDQIQNFTQNLQAFLLPDQDESAGDEAVSDVPTPIEDFIDSQRLNYNLGSAVAHLASAGLSKLTYIQEVRIAHRYLEREIKRIEDAASSF